VPCRRASDAGSRRPAHVGVRPTRACAVRRWRRGAPIADDPCAGRRRSARAVIVHARANVGSAVRPELEGSIAIPGRARTLPLHPGSPPGPGRCPVTRASRARLLARSFFPGAGLSAPPRPNGRRRNRRLPAEDARIVRGSGRGCPPSPGHFPPESRGRPYARRRRWLIHSIPGRSRPSATTWRR
jgi:hypothetical protein